MASIIRRPGKVQSWPVPTTFIVVTAPAKDPAAFGQRPIYRSASTGVKCAVTRFLVASGNASSSGCVLKVPSSTDGIRSLSAQKIGIDTVVGEHMPWQTYGATIHALIGGKSGPIRSGISLGGNHIGKLEVFILRNDWGIF